MTTKSPPSNTQEQPAVDASNEHAVRRLKVDKLRELGIDPWPPSRPVSITTDAALQSFDEANNSQPEHTLAGRLMSKRDHGKTFFAHIKDRTGTLQLYIKKDLISENAFTLFSQLIDIGDIIWVRGTLFKTRKGEVTLQVKELHLASKSLWPLPEKYHGLADVEQRYRQRYLDLISNEESRQKFIARSHIVRQIRNFLEAKDFLEVETPMLHPIPGGATARPFVTHHNAYDMDLYLRVAPELYLKQLVVGGLERVFEINRNFRNEGVSTRHNPEFTSVEFYMAHGSFREGMQITEELFRDAVKTACGSLQIPFQDYTLDFEKPFTCMSVEEAVIKVGGFSAADIAADTIDIILAKYEIELHPEQSHAEKVYALFDEVVESKLIQPTFITDFPTAVSPLARSNDDDPTIAERFELFIAGMELANSFSELNNPFDQAERFKHQVNARDRGDAEAHHYDAAFVRALEQGLPPTVGVGFGLDRFVMLLTNTTSIKDVILFPTMKRLET